MTNTVTSFLKFSIQNPCLILQITRPVLYFRINWTIDIFRLKPNQPMRLHLENKDCPSLEGLISTILAYVYLEGVQCLPHLLVYVSHEQRSLFCLHADHPLQMHGTYRTTKTYLNINKQIENKMHVNKSMITFPDFWS